MSGKEFPPLSQRSLALLTGMSRDSVRSALATLKLQPVGKAGGHDLYDAADALRGLFQSRATHDPDSLCPFERRQHYEAELRKLELAKRSAEVVSRADVQQASATAFATCAQSLRSIPDNLERRLGLDPDVAAEVGIIIDEAMNDLADQLEAVAKKAERLAADAK